MACSYCSHCPACGDCMPEEIEHLEAEVWSLQRQAEADKIVIGDFNEEVKSLRETLSNVEFYLRRSGLADECAPTLIAQLAPFRVD
jgi:hypothetical protein